MAGATKGTICQLAEVLFNAGSVMCVLHVLDVHYRFPSPDANILYLTVDKIIARRPNHSLPYLKEY